jgi:Ca-activated chloride channel homolog
VRLKVRFLSVFLGIVVSASLTSRAQTSEGIPVPRDPGVVRLQFLILDAHDLPVRVAPSNITILDRKEPAKSLASLQVGSDAPIRVGLLIDTSHSMRSGIFKEAIVESTQFVRTVLTSSQDKAFVVKFDKITQATKFMNREQFMDFKLDVVPAGGTALYDSIVFASSELMREAGPATATRVVLVVISDGNDNQSHFGLEQAIAVSQQAGVMIFTLSTNEIGARSRGDRVLRELANATGGEAFFPTTTELPAVFHKIEQQIANTYVAVYSSTDEKQDNRFRPVEVKVSDKKLRTRAPKGYFSRPTTQ